MTTYSELELDGVLGQILGYHRRHHGTFKNATWAICFHGKHPRDIAAARSLEQAVLAHQEKKRVADSKGILHALNTHLLRNETRILSKPQHRGRSLTLFLRKEDEERRARHKYENERYGGDNW